MAGIRGGVNLGGGEGYGRTISSGQADFTASTRNQLLDAAASASSGDIVFVPGSAEIDVGSRTVSFSPGVVIASNRGQGGSDGGHIRRTSGFSADDDAMLSISGGRVTGLRLSGHYHRENDPHDGSVVRLTGGDAEVDNCEISGGGYAAVNGGDGNSVHVHHCHIHDNVASGNGYGVAVPDFAEVNANTFERNRHAVTGRGNESYEVYDNWFGAGHTHHVVDMHGQVDAPGGTNLHIHHNKCEAADVSFVRVNGVPSEMCRVESNWIFNTNDPCVTTTGWSDCAIHQTNTTTGFTNFTFGGNHYGTEEPPQGGGAILAVLVVLGGLGAAYAATR